MALPMLSKETARYRDNGGREHCSLCRHFIPDRGGSCRRVLGRINPRGWCKLFSQEVYARIADVTAGTGGGGGPSLGLDFMTPGVLDPRITFTRASTATYFNSAGVMQTAATNAPRWDYDPSTLALRGLLIEEARTNLAFPSVNWQPNQPANASQDGVTQNVGVSPSGANNAMAFIAGSTNTVHQTYRSFAGAVSTTYTYSVYLKAAGISRVNVTLGNTGFPSDQVVYVDLLAGTIRGQSANGSGKMQSVGNGWYRCSVSNTSSGTAGNYITAAMLQDLADSPVFAGNNVNGIWLWGEQVEAGAFPTSYIPTTSAAVTRAVDSCMITSANMAPWFVAGSSSWVAEFIALNPAGAGSGTRIVGNNSPGGATSMYLDTSSRLAQYDISSAVGTVNSTTANTLSRGATTWATGSAKACANGGAVASSAALTQGYGTHYAGGIRFMATGTVADGLSGYLRRVAYYARALSDAEMQTVTTL